MCIRDRPDTFSTYELKHSADGGTTWTVLLSGVSPGVGILYNNFVDWGDLVACGISNDRIVTVSEAGALVSYTLPFVLQRYDAYNNLAVVDGYMHALSTTGVWRSGDLVNWTKVWSILPGTDPNVRTAYSVKSLSAWGDSLVVSTNGAEAAILARPASPEAARQQMLRDALKLAASPGAAAAGSTDADLDAIRLITDAIDTSAVTVTSTNSAGVLAFTQGVTFAATVSGLTISATWAKLYFTLKESDYDTDDLALLQLVETNPGAGTDGLLYLNSAALVLPIAVTDGTLTVSQAAGTVTIAITDNAMAQLSKASGLVWDIKTKDAAGATVQNATGTASIARAITQTI